MADGFHANHRLRCRGIDLNAHRKITRSVQRDGAGRCNEARHATPTAEEIIEPEQPGANRAAVAAEHHHLGAGAGQARGQGAEQRRQPCPPRILPQIGDDAALAAVVALEIRGETIRAEAVRAALFTAGRFDCTTGDSAPFAVSRASRRQVLAMQLAEYGLLALVLATLAVVSFSVLTGRAHVGVPTPAPVVAERVIYLQGGGAQAVTVLDENRALLLDLPHGGFVTVIQSAMARARLVARVEGNPPMKVIRYDNGRLVAEDPATGWSAELYAFGQDNKAAFERLLTDKK